MPAEPTTPQHDPNAADAAAFQRYRPLLFSIAYRMLGSATEADDVLQDAYLRFTTTPRQPIRSLKAYLSTVVTRLCLDHLKAAKTVREHYIGPWLPEPVLTLEGETEMLRTIEQRESISLAFLVLLESLTPQERAVFLLREVFEFDYQEIADTLGTTAANCRQLFRRAKARISEQRPRFGATPERQQELVDRFLAATQRGDLHGLTRLLAHDVLYRADGGGKVPAARRPITGAAAVARVLIALAQQRRHGTAALSAPGALRITVAEVNGGPAILVWAGATLDTLFGLTLAGKQIVDIQAIRNPDKLRYIRRQLDARREEDGSLPTESTTSPSP